MRLNWRSQRPAAKWKGVLPEYDPSVVFSAPAKDDHGGVLFAWDPNIMEKLEEDHVLRGRVLRVRLRMLHDDFSFDLFVCYMPVSSRSAEFHRLVWTALIEAASAAMSASLIIGDLNAETATRLKKTYGIDINKRAGKRPGEAYLHKLMSGNYSEDGSIWTRLGSEKTTFQCVEKVADGEGPDQYSYHVIDHVLQGPGMDKALAAGTHFVHGSKQYHLSVEIEIVTVAPELVQTCSSMKPKLGRMPQQPMAPRVRAKALAKRAAERADALPERDYTGAGSLVDDADVMVSDDELFERRPLNDEMDAEPVGWAAYQDRVTAEAIESLRDYDMKRELAQTGTLDALRKEKRGLTEEETAAALRSASMDFRLKHGTRTEILMETCKRVAREEIGAPAATNACKQSDGERLRRRITALQQVLQSVSELRATSINFEGGKGPPTRWEILDDVDIREVRDLYGAGSTDIPPDLIKAKELAIAAVLIERTEAAYHEIRAATRLDYAIAQLEKASEQEIGFGRQAEAIIRRERPGALSRKDKGPGNTLVALRSGEGDRLLTGLACDEAVANLVEEANRASNVDMEAAGKVRDLLKEPRGCELGGRSAQASGALFSIVERAASERLQLRSERRRVRLLALNEPPPGAYVEVGNYLWPEARHKGRVHLRCTRGEGSLLCNPFRMGADGRDESLRDTVIRCYAEWYEGGRDAYEVAERNRLPLAYVVAGPGRLLSGDISGEIEAIVEMVTNCDERVLLQCCCAPAKCHLDHIAGICNLKITAVLEERARKGKHAQRAGPSDAKIDAQSLQPAATDSSAEGAAESAPAEGKEEATDAKDAANATPTPTAANTKGKPRGADDGQTDEGACTGLHGKARDRAWRREFEAGLMRHEPDEQRRETVENYWTEEYPILYDEDDDVCVDGRVHELLIRRLTPGRLAELSKKMKEKLATGLDEFTQRSQLPRVLDHGTCHAHSQAGEGPMQAVGLA
jgi:hypothetical protein